MMRTSHRSAAVRAAAAALTVLTAAALAPVAPATSAATTAAPARVAAADTARRVADIDGDGRKDTVTVTTVSTRNYVQQIRLTVRTRTRTSSIVVRNPFEFEPTPAKYVLMGTAPVDGVRGNEILLNLSPDVGDAETYMVYTMRRGKLGVLAPPGAGTYKDWDCFGPYLGTARGYTFSTKKGVRYVTRHQLQLQDGRYVGRSSLFRWTNKGWKIVSTRTTNVLESSGKNYAHWHGITWT